MTRPQRVIQLPAYTALVLVATGVLSPILSVVASVQIAEGSTERQVTARDRQSEQLREEQRLRSCSVYGALVAALEESPPTAPAGKALLETYREQFKIRRCG